MKLLSGIATTVALFYTLSVSAQVTNRPTGFTTPMAGTSANIPNPAVAQTPATYNYTRQWSPIYPTTATTVPSVPAYYSMQTTYTNGFGQPLQSITRRGGKDIVTSVDQRVLLNQAHYLPYPANGSGVGYQPNSFFDEVRWYDNSYPSEGDNAYTRTEALVNNGKHYTASYPAGRSFTGNGKGVKVSAEINSNNIPKLTTTPFLGELYPLKTGNYATGDLIVKKTEESDGQLSLEYATKADSSSASRLKRETALHPKY